MTIKVFAKPAKTLIFIVKEQNAVFEKDKQNIQFVYPAKTVVFNEPKRGG